MNKTLTRLKQQRPSQSGFTLIEVLVVAVISAILTTMIAVNFRQLRESQQISSAAADFVSKIRDVQNRILTGKLVTGQTEAADAYEVVLTSGSVSYRVDSDINGTINTLETVDMGVNTKLQQVYIDNVPTGSLTLRITAPFGKILANGIAQKTVKVDVYQISSGRVKSIIIDGQSGRIGLQ